MIENLNLNESKMDNQQDAFPTTSKSVENLEVKDAQVIFTNVWNELEAEFGHENLRFSKELILLGGAPGAGKGTNTEFIMKARDLTCAPIVVSSLLSTPQACRIKQAGGMVGDREVVELVFRKLLEKEYRDGCVLDGFPRTRVQVECLNLLVLKMNQLSREYRETPLAINFRKPTIHVMVLFVDETTSIERQLSRGREVAEWNAKAIAEGKNSWRNGPRTWTRRPPDAATASSRTKPGRHCSRSRRSITITSLTLRGPSRVLNEIFATNSTTSHHLELDPETHDAVRHLPLASDLITHARQELVRRMDSYQLEHRSLFHKVIRLIEDRFIPIVIRHAIPGMAIVNSEDPLFDDPLALAMVIDIFAERGYRAVANVNRAEIPESVNLETGRITCSTKRIYRFQIRFAGSEIRRGGG